MTATTGMPNCSRTSWTADKGLDRPALLAVQGEQHPGGMGAGRRG